MNQIRHRTTLLQSCQRWDEVAVSLPCQSINCYQQRVHFCFDINNEYNAPNVLNKDSTRMHWSSNRTKSTDMDSDKCRVIVYSSDMPANSPWKNVVILNSLFCSYVYSICISAQKESTVKFYYSYFYWWVYFMWVYEIWLNVPLRMS